MRVKWDVWVSMWWRVKPDSLLIGIAPSLEYWINSPPMYFTLREAEYLANALQEGSKLAEQIRMAIHTAKQEAEI